MAVRAMSIAAIALLALAGCGEKKGKDVDKLDRELVGNAADPALTSALEDQIMVDPALTQAANGHSARAVDTSRRAQVPQTMPGSATTSPAGGAGSGKVTLGELAKLQAGRGKDGAGCDHDVQYGAGWANRLPDAFPLYPGAQLSEAAGKDTPSCRLRVASFVVAAPMQQILDWYQARAARAGFSAEHKADGAGQILAGDRAADGVAFYIFLNPRVGGGTEVDLVVNNGR